MGNRLYTKQFREQAVKLVTEQGYAPHQAATQLGIPASTLESWLRKIGYQRQPIVEPPLAEDPCWRRNGARGENGGRRRDL